MRARSSKLLIFTIGMLVLVLIVGPFIRGTVGALPVYALMLIPTLPGLWAFARTRILLAVVGLSFFAVGAAPQVLQLVAGTLDQDPFLTFRVDQSGELGVPIWSFVLLGSPILATWALLLWAQIARKGTAEISLLTGWFIAFVLLSFNDLWGFGQEPYRFWINAVVVFVFIAALTLPTAFPVSAAPRWRLSVLIGLAVALVGASLWNVGGFRAYVSSQGNIDFDSPRYNALAELASLNVPVDSLITAEPCLDPRIVKTITGEPVAYYNAGIAWPAGKAEIDALINANVNGVLDIELMRAAGVQYVVTDSGCPTQWYPGRFMGVAQAGSVEYMLDGANQRLDLWRIL